MRLETINSVLIGGNHLGLLIGADHPPYTASHDEALRHYGAGDRYEIWCAWRSIMNLRDEFELECAARLLDSDRSF